MRLHVTYGTESEPESARVSYPVSGWLVEIPHSGTRVEIAATCVSRTLWLRVVYARLSLSFHPGPRSRPVMVFMHTAWTQHASAALLFYILVYITHICVSYLRYIIYEHYFALLTLCALTYLCALSYHVSYIAWFGYDSIFYIFFIAL